MHVYIFCLSLYIYIYIYIHIDTYYQLLLVIIMITMIMMIIIIVITYERQESLQIISDSYLNVEMRVRNMLQTFFLLYFNIKITGRIILRRPRLPRREHVPRACHTPNLRGKHLSDATCLTHDFFKGGKKTRHLERCGFQR